MVVTALSKFGIFNFFKLSQETRFLENDTVFLALVILSCVEIFCDKFRYYFIKVTTFVSVARPIVGLGVGIAVLKLSCVEQNCIAAFILGAALGTPFMRLRETSVNTHQARKLGTANLMLSLLEDIIALAMPIFAFFKPIITLVLLIAFVFMLLLHRYQMQRPIKQDAPVELGYGYREDPMEHK